jgi:hypothetical protein
MGSAFQAVVRLFLIVAIATTCMLTVRVMQRLSSAAPADADGMIKAASSSASSASRIRIPEHVLRAAGGAGVPGAGGETASPPRIRGSGAAAAAEEIAAAAAAARKARGGTARPPTGGRAAAAAAALAGPLPEEEGDIPDADLGLPSVWGWDEVEAVQGGAALGLGGNAPPAAAAARPRPGGRPASPPVEPSAAQHTGHTKDAEEAEDAVELELPVVRAAAADSPSQAAPPPLPPAAAAAADDQGGPASASSAPAPSDPFIGSDADLKHHRGNAQCWHHFDFGMLEDWNSAAATFCSPTTDPAASPSDLEARPLSAVVAAPGESWLVCRVTQDSHLPAATAPHTLCDGANLVLDIGRLQPTSCLPSRPGYKCDGPPVHWAFGAGAFSGACARKAPFQSSSFPRDHLMDMFNSFSDGASAAEVAAAPAASGDVVLVLARERAEHANPFHATTDFLNAFFALHAAGIVDGLSGSREGMGRVQVLLLDEQTGPFETPLLKRVFSPDHPLLRVSSLLDKQRDEGGRGLLRLPRALFVPPGYTNMLLAHVASEGDCHAGTHLFQSFRRFVLAAFPTLASKDVLDGDVGGGGPVSAGAGAAPASPPVAVTFISRRPYTEFVEHTFIGRQVDNEDALLDAMRQVPGVRVRLHDFARMPVEAQIETMARTEVLVGMHGAALTFALYMPHHGAVVELWPKDRDMWRCFEHLSAMGGLWYRRWMNTNPSAFRVDGAGDYTTVDIAAFSAMFAEAVEAARSRRGTKLEFADGDGATRRDGGDDHAGG